METHVSEKYRDRHYHDASEHGVAWAILNEMLHLIVFVYTLYGMIQFKVKFIHAVKLVRWLSYIIIVHNWYLTIKFASIAIIMYLFNDKLESIGTISLIDYNCSLANHIIVFEKLAAATEAANNSKRINENFNKTPILLLSSSSAINNEQTITLMNEVKNESNRLLIWFKLLPNLLKSLDFPLMYSQFLNVFGGPFKLLGNRATLMYGFYSIAIYIMLAIFPIELMYNTVGFNFIRFVLSDSSCMRDVYNRRERHLNRLTSWSSNETNSELTLGTKMTLNQRDLRSRYADDCNRLAIQLIMANMMTKTNNNNHAEEEEEELEEIEEIELDETGSLPAKTTTTTTKRIEKQWSNSMQRLSRKNLTIKLETAEYKLAKSVKPLRSKLTSNQQSTGGPYYQIKVANKNLKKFKPFIRSDAWFKLSMIVYPIFIFFYFSFLTLVLGTISIYFGSTLKDVSETCARQVNGNINLLTNWSLLDKLLYFETQYTVFAIGFASSFYCSYYFGTIMELIIWEQELEQQMNLCRIVIEISDYEQTNFGVFVASQQNFCFGQTRKHLTATQMLRAKTVNQLCQYNGDSGGEKKQNYSNNRERSDKLRLKNNEEEFDEQVEQCFNEFGGIKSYWLNWKLAQSSSQLKKFKTLELIAIKLLKKKQTLSRATYLNMNLFIDELNATRFMSNTILRRTTQITFGFALLASITRSQFKANYWHLTFFLAACLAILNLYLACAAIVNSNVNKLLVRVHSLICASLRTSISDADLFEFWVRHIRSVGEDCDVMSYKIYGYKITWATIMNFDSAMCTAYFYTIY